MGTEVARYLIGIDFGTTNCAMAYTLLGDKDERIETFSIPQLVASGEIQSLPLMPSFIYFPLEEELQKGVAVLPWEKERTYCVGHYARERGGEMPGRLIASAKSWLCHGGIDRRAQLLPAASQGGEGARFSPLEACTALFVHLKEAWDNTMKAPLASQEVLVTVPASFDPSARQLIEEAAEKAGYGPILLLEEPQAAFYAWLYRHKEEWRKMLAVGDTVLVVDIGGGTTDFSTIEVEDIGGELSLERRAVGSHLLLGGDNLDHSLAYLAKDRIEEKGTPLDAWQLQGLVHACRRGKEKLLSDPAAKVLDLTVAGRGSKLIGGAIKVKLTREEAIGTILEGFLPTVEASEQSPAERLAGLRQVGLPYAQDARITCQLAKFLSQTGEGESGSLERFVIPAAVLFNGGTMKGGMLRERLSEQLSKWASAFGKEAVRELPGADYEGAVSCGAVYYGLARKGMALRIRAGTSRSYFVGVEDAAPAIPGRAPPLKAICIAPFGMEEGSEEVLNSQEFALALGQTATFRFFSHSTPELSDGTEPSVGTWVPNWQRELIELHPIEALLTKGADDGKVVNVTLRSHVTELGVLELWCEASDGRKWKLEFDSR